MQIREITIEGSPSAAGAAHGEILRNEIADLYGARLEILLGIEDVDEPKVRAVGQSTWRSIEDSFPRLTEELSATALAAKLEPWQLVVAGAYTDLMDVLTSTVVAAKTDADECTVVVDPVQGVLAGTWDSHPEAMAAMVVVKRRVDHALPTLALTTAGWPCQFGINSRGLCFGITNLTPSRGNTDGLPYIAAIAAVSGQPSATEAVELLSSLQYAGGHSYLIMDSQEAWIAETTGEDIVLNQKLARTEQANHYQTSVSDNESYKFLAGSIQRVDEAAGVGHAVSSPSLYVQWLSNSAYVLRGHPRSGSVTCAAFYMKPGESTIWLSPSVDIGPDSDMYCYSI